MPNVRNSLAADSRPDLASMDLAELEAALEARGHPRFHARQIFSWIYAKGVTDFEKMTDLSRPLRADLAEHFRISTPRSSRTRHVVRRHGEVPARPRRRPAHRVGVHPRHAEPDVLHLDAGRLRDEVRLLPDRQDGAGPQPDRRRDRRAGPRAGAASSACSTRSSTSC